MKRFLSAALVVAVLGCSPAFAGPQVSSGAATASGTSFSAAKGVTKKKIAPVKKPVMSGKSVAKKKPLQKPQPEAKK